MIVYEPAVESGLARAARPRRRELARFLDQAIAAAGLDGEVSVLIAGDDAIRALNRRYRRKDQATDVLSFPAAEGTGVAGDLVVSLETAARQAAKRGHSLETEIKVLLLHGVLHLSGYDHETDGGRMRRTETRLRRELGLAAGLIERSQLDTATPRSGRQSRAAAANPSRAVRA